MVSRQYNPWECETKSGLVRIGANAHSLHVSTSGPPRRHGEPVLIFFTGGGTPGAVHLRLRRLLSGFTRVYFYDRPGYDRSERGSEKVLTAQGAAHELTRLLAAILVAPPYVLLGESYGCIVARAFLDLHGSNSVVVGLILAEAATELMYELFPRIPHPALEVVAAGVDWAELTNLRRESMLTDEEWDAAMCATRRSESAALAEDNHGSGRTLAQSQQFQNHILDPRALCVIRCNQPADFRLLYDAGVKKGQGTEEQRALARDFIEKFELFDDELTRCTAEVVDK